MQEIVRAKDAGGVGAPAAIQAAIENIRRLVHAARLAHLRRAWNSAPQEF